MPLRPRHRAIPTTWHLLAGLRAAACEIDRPGRLPLERKEIRALQPAGVDAKRGGNRLRLDGN